MTPNVQAMPSPGGIQAAGTFSQGFINPPILPPISDTRTNLRSALLDQLAGFQTSLFQHLFPIPQNPDIDKTTFAYPGSQQQLQAVLIDINNIKMTIVTLNQICNTPANRIPAGTSIDTNPNYSFLDSNVMAVCDNIARAIINDGSLQTAQFNYTNLRNLLNPFYGY